MCLHPVGAAGRTRYAAEVLVAARAVTSVVGLLLWWSAMWVFFDECLRDLWPETPTRNVLYLVFGLAGLALTRTFMFQLNIPVDLRPVSLCAPRDTHIDPADDSRASGEDEEDLEPSTTSADQLLGKSDDTRKDKWLRRLHVVRILVSMHCLLIAWVGYYELMGFVFDLEDEVDMTTYWTWLYVIGGQALGVVTDTLPLPCDQPQRPYIEMSQLKWQQNAGLVLRALIGFSGDIITWVGIDALLVNYDKPTQVRLPKIIYMGVGLTFLYLSKTVPVHAGIHDTEFTLKGPPQATEPTCADEAAQALLGERRAEEADADVEASKALLEDAKLDSADCQSANPAEQADGVLPGDAEANPDDRHVDAAAYQHAFPATQQHPCWLKAQQIQVKVQTVVGSLAFFTLWTGIESTLYFFGPDSPDPDLKTWWIQLLTAWVGLLIMALARTLVPGLKATPNSSARMTRLC